MHDIMPQARGNFDRFPRTVFQRSSDFGQLKQPVNSTDYTMRRGSERVNMITKQSFAATLNHIKYTFFPTRPTLVFLFSLLI